MSDGIRATVSGAGRVRGLWRGPGLALNSGMTTAPLTLPRLADFRRIVVKVGSSLLVDADGVRRAWLDSLATDLAALQARGAEVMVVSSGAIALGRRVLALPGGALKLEDSQAAAAVGQIALARTWAEALGAVGLTAGQILVTFMDTEERRRYLNALAAGDGPYGIVDIGSNSVRLVVYERMGRAPLPRFNEKSLCRLGEGLAQTGAIHPDNFRRTVEACAASAPSRTPWG